MTTVVAIQGDTFAVIACDSRLSAYDGSGIPYLVTTAGVDTSKVALVGKYLIGAAGDVRAINILHYAFTPPTPKANVKGKALNQFITTNFIPALRQCFEAHGYSKESDNTEILIAINGFIYNIDSDFSWATSTSNTYAIGTGSTYALGALQTMSTRNIPTAQIAKRNALKALRVAAKFDPFTGEPFITYCQTNN